MAFHQSTVAGIALLGSQTGDGPAQCQVIPFEIDPTLNLDA
jgi:hypothetical protein